MNATTTQPPLSRACDCCGFLTSNLIDNERAGIKCVQCTENCSERCADNYAKGERAGGECAVCGDDDCAKPVDVCHRCSADIHDDGDGLCGDCYRAEMEREDVHEDNARSLAKFSRAAVPFLRLWVVR